MGKILLILQREYLTRVKKKSFIIMTLLGPILLAAVMVIPMWLAINSSSDQKILVIDHSNFFENELENGEKIIFEYIDLDLDKAKIFIKESDYSGLLYIPQMELHNTKELQYFSSKGAGVEVTSFMKRKITDRIKNLKLKEKGFNNDEIEALSTKIQLKTLKITAGEDEQTNTTAATMIGYISAILIYMFIFMYGVQIMKGVMEEKSNRIVEVIISSVKPFELMMGKVLGVAAVSLTQFLAWIILSFGVTTFLSSFSNVNDFKQENIEQTLMETQNVDQAMDMHTIVSAMQTINFPLVIGCFLFFFFAGYLIYASLFAAVGAAVDNDTDTQQFMLPITIPMIVAFVVAQGIMKDPESPMAFWFSIFPLTSPVVMPIRIPFDIPFWEILLSMALLIIGFISTIWFAAKIYRVGILMYGKKVSYKEIGKWLFYKN